MTFDVKTLDAWTQQAMAPEMTPVEKDLRDKFVTEMLVDYQPTAAAMRIGFQKAFAEDYAKKFMDEPYVQQQIKLREQAAGIQNDKDRTSRVVMAVLYREAHYFGAGGSSASRIAAANSLAKYLGMEPPTKVQSEVTVNSPVQFYIPHNGRDPLPVPVATPVADK